MAERLRATGGGDAAVQALVDAGVDTVFGIPASHVIEVYDALGRMKAVRTVVARNEQAAAYMADGYARRSRRPGVAVVTGGPGLGNAVTGLQTAYADSSPVVVVTSDLDPYERARVPLGIPHEAFDSGGLVQATGATLTRADDPDAVYSAVRDALGAAARGRHRPSVCLLARAALEGRLQSEPQVPESTDTHEAGPGDLALEKVLELLAKSRRPVVLAGAGIGWARAEALLESFLRRTGIPCVTTVPGRSAIDDCLGSWAGVVDDDAARRRLSEADLVLAFGTSFGWTTTQAWTLELRGALVHVDIDPAELGRHYEPAIGIAADVADFLRALGDPTQLPAFGAFSPAARTSHPWIEALDEALPETGLTVACDVTMALRWLGRSMSFGPNRRLLVPWNYMGMGWAYGAAIGAKAASDDAVVAVMGDGGALFSVGELATAVENDLPVCLIVFNNRSYGTIAELQDLVCEGRRFAVDLRGPDFASVGTAFGVESWQVETPTKLAEAARQSVRRNTPTVIEVLLSVDELRA